MQVQLTRGLLRTMELQKLALILLVTTVALVAGGVPSK